MRIIPKRGLNIGTGTAPVHAPAGLPVEVPDALGRELISFDVAILAPPPAPAVQNARAPAAPETAAAQTLPSPAAADNQHSTMRPRHAPARRGRSAETAREI